MPRTQRCGTAWEWTATGGCGLWRPGRPTCSSSALLLMTPNPTPPSDPRFKNASDVAHTTRTAATDAHVSVPTAVGARSADALQALHHFGPQDRPASCGGLLCHYGRRGALLSINWRCASLTTPRAFNQPPPTLVVAVLPLCHTRAVSLLRTSGHRATPVSPLTLSISVPCPWRCSYALSRGFGTGHERPAHANPGVVPGTHTLPQGPMAPHLTQSFGGWTGAHEVPQFGSIRRRQAPNSNKRKEAQCHL